MKYSGVITEHFQRPRNCGPLAGATCTGEAQNPACLDRLRLHLNIDPRTGRVTQAAFEAEGCVPSLAIGSFLTEYVIGKSADELRSLTAETLEEETGGLPATKKHAAHLGIDALRDALAYSDTTRP